MMGSWQRQWTHNRGIYSPRGTPKVISTILCEREFEVGGVSQSLPNKPRRCPPSSYLVFSMVSNFRLARSKSLLSQFTCAMVPFLRPRAPNRSCPCASELWARAYRPAAKMLRAFLAAVLQLLTPLPNPSTRCKPFFATRKKTPRRANESDEPPPPDPHEMSFSVF